LINSLKPNSTPEAKARLKQHIQAKRIELTRFIADFSDAVSARARKTKYEVISRNAKRDTIGPVDESDRTQPTIRIRSFASAFLMLTCLCRICSERDTSTEI
jgi:hypothetical protein